MTELTPNASLRVVLDLVAHPSVGRGRRNPNPDLERLRNPAWWNHALFGPQGYKDPIPLVHSVVSVSDAPLDQEEVETGPAVVIDEDPRQWPLTSRQMKAVEALVENPTHRYVRADHGSGGFVRIGDHGRGESFEQIHGNTSRALIKGGYLVPVERPVRGYTLSVLAEEVDR